MVLLLQQILIVCLVILDALLVLGELLMDLKIIHPDKYNITPKVKYRVISLPLVVQSPLDRMTGQSRTWTFRCAEAAVAGTQMKASPRLV